VDHRKFLLELLKRNQAKADSYNRWMTAVYGVGQRAFGVEPAIPDNTHAKFASPMMTCMAAGMK
jgi:hypothetical protein